MNDGRYHGQDPGWGQQQGGQAPPSPYYGPQHPGAGYGGPPPQGPAQYPGSVYYRRRQIPMMGQRMQVLVLSIVTAVLILIGLFGSWAGGLEVSSVSESDNGEVEKDPPMKLSQGLSFGEIITLKDQMEYSISMATMGEDDEGTNVTVKNRPGALYYSLYALIPTAILILVFGIFAMMPRFTGMSFSKLKRKAVPVIYSMSVLTMLLGIMGMVLVLTEETGYHMQFDTGFSSMAVGTYYTFTIGYAGIVTIVGGVLGMITGVKAAAIIRQDGTEDMVRPY